MMTFPSLDCLKYIAQKSLILQIERIFRMPNMNFRAKYQNSNLVISRENSKGNYF